MTGVPTHPAIVHLPMALAILVPLVALALTAALWRGWLPRRSWVGVVALQVLLVGSGLVALRTGEGDEERVERIVAERVIEAHEEAATVFLWGAGIVLVLMIAALLRRSAAWTHSFAVAATLGTLAVAGLGYRTGKAGGELVYVHGAAGAYAGSSGIAPPEGNAQPSTEKRDHDD